MAALGLTEVLVLPGGLGAAAVLPVLVASTAKGAMAGKGVQQAMLATAETAPLGAFSSKTGQLAEKAARLAWIEAPVALAVRQVRGLGRRPVLGFQAQTVHL